MIGELGVPPADLTYYKTSFQQQYYYPFTERWVGFVNAELGVAGGYDNKSLPFFKNFFVGGVNSVRGYRTGTIGPKDIQGAAVGADKKIVLNAELLFPLPGMGKDKSIRMIAFADAGTVSDSWDLFLRDAILGRTRCELVLTLRTAQGLRRQGHQPQPDPGGSDGGLSVHVRHAVLSGDGTNLCRGLYVESDQEAL